MAAAADDTETLSPPASEPSSSSSTPPSNIPSSAQETAPADQTAGSSAASIHTTGNATPSFVPPPTATATTTGGPAAAVTPALAPPTSDKKERTVLRRNMACHQCRRRKLKCDSIRPMCSPCARAKHAFLTSLPPGLPPPPPEETEHICTYDEMTGPFRKLVSHANASATGSRAKRGKSKDASHSGEGEGDGEKEKKMTQLERENVELKKLISMAGMASAAAAGPASATISPAPTDLYTTSPHLAMSSRQAQAPIPPTTNPIYQRHSPYSIPHSTFTSSSANHAASSVPSTSPLTVAGLGNASSNPASQFSSFSTTADASSRSNSISNEPPTTAAAPYTTFQQTHLQPPPPPPQHLFRQQHAMYPKSPPASFSPGLDLFATMPHPASANAAASLDKTTPAGATGQQQKLDWSIETNHAINGTTSLVEMGVLLSKGISEFVNAFDLTTPLLPHLFPPSPSQLSLPSRALLPSGMPLSLHPSLSYAIACLALRTSNPHESDTFARLAAAEIFKGQSELIALRNTPFSSPDANERFNRLALDICIAAVSMPAHFHMSGKWAETFIFGPLSLSLCNLVGLDPSLPPRTSEYALNFLSPPKDVHEFGERQRIMDVAVFDAVVSGVANGRGVLGIEPEEYLVQRFGPHRFLAPITTSTSTLEISMKSALLLAKVDNFNRKLQSRSPEDPTASLLNSYGNEKVFMELEFDVDRWCSSLGLFNPDTNSPREIGEVLGAKVLAEHARVLLYYVHLPSSTYAQRAACLSAAQSISQSCIYASSLAPTSIPSFCLHSYFLSAQVLLQFKVALPSQDFARRRKFEAQVEVIRETFERLGKTLPVAEKLGAILEEGVRDISTVLRCSMPQIYDMSFHNSFSRHH